MRELDELLGVETLLFDPLVDPAADVQREYGLDLVSRAADLTGLDAVLLAVPHR